MIFLVFLNALLAMLNARGKIASNTGVQIAAVRKTGATDMLRLPDISSKSTLNYMGDSSSGRREDGNYINSNFSGDG